MSEDLYDLIEKRRLELGTQLAAELEKRDVANNAIRAIRAQLDDLPVRKVRRTKREKTTDPFEKVEWPNPDAGLEDVRGKP